MAELCLKKVAEKKYEIVSGMEAYTKAKSTGVYVVKANVTDEDGTELGGKIIKMKEIMVD